MNHVEDIPTGELGPEHDAAMEVAIELEADVYHLRRMHVDLDAIADSHVLSSVHMGRVREIQESVRMLADSLEVEATDARERQHSIRERLSDLGD